MAENNDFWNFYWETRLRPMETLGKRAAILATSKLIRQISPQIDHPLRLLELGCGEGQIIGMLLDAHSQVASPENSVAVDYDPVALATCRKDYPALRCVEGDFTDSELISSFGKFDILILVNALHHVFSDSYSDKFGEVDVPVGKQRVEQAFTDAVNCLEPGGWVVLFDGIEIPGDPDRLVQLCFQDNRALRNFEKFARTYKPFRVSYRKTSSLCVEVPQRHYNRYMTKSIFLEKKLWDSERFESYQYFTETEFRATFTRNHLEITEYRPLTVNEQKWRRQVNIEASSINFPNEHVLILGQKK